MRRAVCSFGLAFLLALSLAPARAAESPRLWLTDAEGNTATPLFADTAVVPGQQLTETLLIHHTDAAGASLELRLDPLTTPNALESDLDLTVSSPAGTTTERLNGLLREDWPLDLGTLPGKGPAPVELTVRLPETSGNDTKKLVTAFRPVVTAYAADLPDRPDTDKPAPTGGPPGANGSPDVTEPWADAGDGPTTDPGGPGTLPHTGTDLLWLFLLIVVCATLGGWLLFRVRRGTSAPGTPRHSPEDGPRP